MKEIIKKNKYPDGSFYTTIEYSHINDWVGHLPNEFTFRLNSYEDLWQLNQIRDVYRHHKQNAVVTIPFLIDSQADRRFSNNESFGLKLVLEFLKDMEWTFIEIFHPHSQEVVESILDNVRIIDNVSFIKDCLDQIYCEKYDIEQDKGIHYFIRKEFSDNVILFSSDAGGFKPLMKLCDKISWKGETYSASKSRKYNNGRSELTQLVDREDFNGKDILIIDDLMIGGGTFIGLANMLKERNIGKLYLAVSHITVQDLKNDLFKLFDHVFTTNSKYDNYFISQGDGGVQPKNLTVINKF